MIYWDHHSLGLWRWGRGWGWSLDGSGFTIWLLYFSEGKGNNYKTLLSQRLSMIIKRFSCSIQLSMKFILNEHDK